MRAFRFSILIATAVAAANRPALGDEGDWKSRLASMIERATARNPSIAEMEAGIEAARQRTIQARALPDPEIEVGIQDIPPSDFSFTRDDFTMEKILARQAFPAAGKRPARERAALAEVASAEALHMSHVVEIAAEVGMAFFDVAGVDTRAEILARSRERLRAAASAAAERYRVGKGAQADVLRANLEVTATEERLAGLAGERRAAVARLNALQGLPPSTPVDPIALPEGEPETPAFADVVSRALGTSPAVASAEAL